MGITCLKYLLLRVMWEMSLLADIRWCVGSALKVESHHLVLFKLKCSDGGLRWDGLDGLDGLDCLDCLDWIGLDWIGWIGLDGFG